MNASLDLWVFCIMLAVGYIVLVGNGKFGCCCDFVADSEVGLGGERGGLVRSVEGEAGLMGLWVAGAGCYLVPKVLFETGIQLN